MAYSYLISNIERLSAEKGITKTKALIESGVGKDFIINIEKKGAIPSIDKVQKLSEYFNVSIDSLLGKNEFKKQSPSEMDELIKTAIELFKMLPKEEQRAYLELLKLRNANRNESK